MTEAMGNKSSAVGPRDGEEAGEEAGAAAGQTPAHPDYRGSREPLIWEKTGLKKCFSCY